MYYGKVCCGNIKVKPKPKDIQNNGLISYTLGSSLNHYASTSLLIHTICIIFNSEYTNFNLDHVTQRS